MPREKPKDMAGRRKAHLALQARRDGLARMRAGEEATIKLVDGITVRARALGEEEHPGGMYILALLNRRLRMGICVDKDGLRVDTLYHGSRHIQPQEVLGVVLEHWKS